MKSASVNVPRQREQPSAPPVPANKQPGGALTPIGVHLNALLKKVKP